MHFCVIYNYQSTQWMGHNEKMDTIIEIIEENNFNERLNCFWLYPRFVKFYFDQTYRTEWIWKRTEKHANAIIAHNVLLFFFVICTVSTWTKAFSSTSFVLFAVYLFLSSFLFDQSETRLAIISVHFDMALFERNCEIYINDARMFPFPKQKFSFQMSSCTSIGIFISCGFAFSSA